MKLFLCLLFVACASAAPSSRIVGGEDSDIEDFPWQVSLQKGGSHFCGASIIGEIYVVSAAHCVQSVPSDIDVGYGNTQYKEAETIRMADWIPHPLYDQPGIERFDYDYSVIILSSALPYGDNVQAITIPGSDTAYLEGDLITSGWGLTSKPFGSIPETLQWAVVPYMNKTVCQEFMDPTTITDRMVCAGSDGATSCNGDSGGPLVKQVGDFTSGDTASNYVLLGAVSFGFSSCPTNAPGVYARLAIVHDWIYSF